MFENTFKQLGWVPGRNLQIDYRWAMGDIQKMRLLAADLVNSAPDAGRGVHAVASGDPEGD